MQRPQVLLAFAVYSMKNDTRNQTTASTHIRFTTFMLPQLAQYLKLG